MTSSPTVSVILGTRNRVELLESALLAIKAQDFADYEVIVIDDGSHADHAAKFGDVLAKLDERFHIERAPAPGVWGSGPSKARNRGIHMARGTFVAFCDDDDIWSATDHLAVAVKTLQRENADVFFAEMQGIKAGEITIPKWFPDCPGLTASPKVLDEPPVHRVPIDRLMQALGNHYPHLNTSVIRRQTLMEVGLFWERTDFAEDINLMLRLADRVDCFLFRATPSATMNLSPRPSAFNDTTLIDRALAGILIAEHARASARKKAVRKCAKGLEAWNLRQLARLTAAQQGRGPTVGRLMQAALLKPSPGVLFEMAKAILKPA